MSKDVFIDRFGNSRTEQNEVVTVTGAEATENRLRIAIKWQLGESIIFRGDGIDFRNIFRFKNPDLSLIASEIRNIVLQDEAVVDVETVDVDFDRANRAVVFDVRGIADEGLEINVRGTIE